MLPQLRDILEKHMKVIQLKRKMGMMFECHLECFLKRADFELASSTLVQGGETNDQV